MTSQRHKKSQRWLMAAASAGGQRTNAVKRSYHDCNTSCNKNQAPPLLTIPIMLQARVMAIHYADQGFYNTSAAWLELFYFLSRQLRGAGLEVTT